MVDLCEFEASMVYIVRSRTARATQRNPVSILMVEILPSMCGPVFNPQGRDGKRKGKKEKKEQSDRFIFPLRVPMSLSLASC